MAIWNPWRGCHKKSEGCINCYIHRANFRKGINTKIKAAMMLCIIAAPHYLFQITLQRISLVRFLPRKIKIQSSEVSVSCCLLIDRSS